MIPRAALLLLLVGCTVGPHTYTERLNQARERLARLAVQQLKTSPDDDRLRLLTAALQGTESALFDDDPLPTPLLAVLACTWTLHQFPGTRFVPPPPEDADEVLAMLHKAAPTSSYGPLFRARRLLLDARSKTDFWAPLASALEEALRRDSWHCPVRDFHLWAQDWIQIHEPDPFVRAAFDFSIHNLARSVLFDVQRVVVGAAFAPGVPRPGLQNLAALACRLAERFAVNGADALDFLVGQAVLHALLPAEFLVAWRLDDLQTARQVADQLDDHGRREAAFDAYKPAYMKTFEIKTFLFKKGLERAFQMPERAEESLRESANDEALLEEAARLTEAGAAAYLAALRADLTRRTSFYSTFGRPAATPRTNVLTRALRDRNLLLSGAFSENRLKDLLDAAFDPGKLDDAAGTAAYSWIVLDALRRPETAPAEVVELRFTGDRAEDMDVALILRARGRPVPEDIRNVARRVQEDPYPEVMHGYCRVLGELATSRPTEAVGWLLPAEGQVPSSAELMIAESLRAATGLDWGPDWPRWKAHLETR